jgi:flagellar biosynthetic protein FliQ
MDETEIIDFAREAIMLTIKLSAPIMLIGLVVGLIIALLQALTQVQEQTISFVPKMMAIYLALFLMLPMMAMWLKSFTELIADKIVGIG